MFSDYMLVIICTQCAGVDNNGMRIFYSRFVCICLLRWSEKKKVSGIDNRLCKTRSNLKFVTNHTKFQKQPIIWNNPSHLPPKFVKQQPRFC